MPADENEVSATAKKYKRSRFSCEFCKTRKIRCDSGTSTDGKCTSCTNSDRHCTLAHEVLKSTIVGSARSYVDNLETKIASLETENETLQNQVEKLKASLLQMLPGVDIKNVLEESSVTTSAAGSTPPSTAIVPRNDSNGAIQKVGGALENLAIRNDHKVFGKASLAFLIRTALYVKEYHIPGQDVEANHMERWKRAHFWKPPACLAYAQPNAHGLMFPSADLTPTLISLYFENINLYYPSLHRPSFETDFAHGRHFDDHKFSRVVLLVCALGSRFSTDRRVNIDTDPDNYQTAGWQWFSQVVIEQDEKASLELLQIYALSIQFKPMVSLYTHWKDVGFAIRLAIDLGAHRSSGSIALSGKDTDSRPMHDRELRKRVFWVLLTLDRELAFILGRPANMIEEDFDQDLVLPCDDEFWYHHDITQCFKQPHGRPSQLCYFNAVVELGRIQGHVMRELYYIKRRPTFGLPGSGAPTSEEDLIASLDSVLNAWFSAIPYHLRWEHIESVFDPTNPFHRQAVCLHASYHQMQIFIHRPFIPTPSIESSVAFPSLTICVGAARACIKMLVVACSRMPWTPTSHVHLALETSALILLIYRWSKKGYDRTESGRRDVGYMESVLEIIRKDEVSLGTGRYWDILQGLVTLDWRASQALDNSSAKRGREQEGSGSDSIYSSPEAPPMWAQNPSNIYGVSTAPVSEIGYGYDHGTVPMVNSSALAGFNVEAMMDWNTFLESLENGWAMEQSHIRGQYSEV